MIDTHAHLDAFEDAGGVLERARGRGRRARDLGRERASSPAGRRWRSAKREDGVFAALGLHPHEAGGVGRPGARGAAGAARPPEGGRGRRDRARLLPRPRAARPAGRGVPAPRPSSPPSSASRSSCTRARPTRTRSRRFASCRRSCPSSSTASRPPRSSSRRSSAAGTSRSPATSPTRRRPSFAGRRPGFPAERLLAETDWPYLAPQPVRGQAERAGVRRPHGRRAGRGARRGGRRHRASGSRRTPPRCSACREHVRAEARAGPALARGREHPPRDRAAGRAQAGRRRARDRPRPRRPDRLPRRAGPAGARGRAGREPRAACSASVSPAGTTSSSCSATRSACSALRLRPAAGEARRQPALQRGDADRRREPRGAPDVERWCVMVQREVADRFFAPPGTKDYGAVSVARSSSPPSGRACIRSRGRASGRRRTWTRRSSPSGGRATGTPSSKSVRRVAQAAFAHRRKTLANSLELAGLADRERRVAALSPSWAVRPTRAPRSWRRRSSVRLGGLRRGMTPARAVAAAKINLALVGGTDGAMTACTRSPRFSSASTSATASSSSAARGWRSRGSRATRSCAAALDRLAAEAGVEPALARPHRRRRSRSRPASAAGARTPPRRSAGQRHAPGAARLGAARRARRRAGRRRAVLPRARGPKLAEGTGERLSPLELPQDFWVLVALRRGLEKASTGAVYARFDELGGGPGFERERQQLVAALARIARGQPTSPRCRRTTSPRPREPRRWPLSSCGGRLSGGRERRRLGRLRPLRESRREARSAARRLGRHARAWVGRTRLVTSHA